MANELTLADISTYVGQLKSQAATVKSVTGIAANGTTTAVEAASPGTGQRWIIMRIVLGVDTAGETLLIEDSDGTDILTIPFPVADLYIFDHLNLEITAAKGFKLDKGTVAGIRGTITYKAIKSGDLVPGF